MRNGAVHILDYKPDARTNKPIAQLTLYALALTRLAGCGSSISSAPGSMRSNTASSSPARFSHMPGREVEARPVINRMVRAAGIEPARGYPQRIFVPATAFAAATNGVCGLDYTFAVA